ncbi:phosphoglucosamine mutase [Hydrogenibacillus schlegelii]|uniref:Phosphoglucosamine mutase n=1 Tax=Hydrogenibacillus schlegelii TaxID=1484 RepID=A0A132N7V7_HYDSH|nr:MULTISPECIES: phosphoglucosamine mutase [Hydrogenibacillus]KWX06057.1 phosphoglucosamine mutase [Hydrogenibacillus schlegelii]MBT9282524.1 phosphoglucosamine mutase [Hydrogenibacillus schlegelii]OAR04320.1 phosphoglucosamine mutase [Hydrogenibacillus schlegelii]PTQ52276.1 MAG: Phosphoglucosamine mutase [Hydrogenibacillus schlegelii]QZA33178.1 phosphoglucosamine mutase [Hydrogenibacillus sp. N12]
MGRYFGTDGIRGVAGRELSAAFALSVGQAAGTVLAAHGRRPKVVVGRDPRLSGEMLEAALVAGLMAAGADVVRLGVMPTPGVAYLTKALGADAGAVISASHNPVEDNGIKFFGPDGFKLSDEDEAAIEVLLDGDPDRRAARSGLEIGRAIDHFEGGQKYLAFLKSAAETSLEGLTVVIDCANGAASPYAARLFVDLGAEVKTIFCQPDGTNINVGCGSTQPEALAKEVVRLGADVGLAFDGDADRLIAVDETGEIVDGDYLLSTFGLLWKEAGRLSGDTIVSTVMANYGLVKFLERHGIRLLMTRVGDRYVVEAMREGGYVLGGEQSGHLVFLDRATTGDGLLTAVLLLGALKRAGKPLSAFARTWEKYPQVLKNVRVRSKEGWEEEPAIREAIAAAEAALAGAGRIVVRPSGTEPLIRVMVEAPAPEQAEAIAAQVAEAIARVRGESVG